MNPKTYLVTGASSGIGAAVGRALSESGARVIGTYNTNAAAAEAAVEAGWLDVVFQVDLASRKSRDTLITDVRELGELAGIVNNAAAIDFAPWEQFSIDEWQRVFEVNVHAAVHLCHGLHGCLRSGGSVVNIASTDGMTGTFASPAYSASKAALINVTKSLGNVLAPSGVRANAIAPGWVDTGMSTGASYSAGKQTPLGRNGRPEEIASVALYLLSSGASFVNGTTLVVDGGYTNVDVIMLQELQDIQDGAGTVNTDG